MALNNPYITRIYDYEEQLLPHPDTESFHAHWEPKGKGVSRVHVEIGCGSGIYLIHLARENPDDVFLGIELRLKRLVLAARKIKKEQLRNVLLIRERGEYLDDYFGSGCIDVLHINFPDPWSKKARRKHRIISERFLEMMHRLFRPNGEIHFKTDHREYFQYANDLLVQSGLFMILDHTIDLQQSKYAETNIRTEFEMLFASKKNPPIGYLRAGRIIH